MVSVRRQLMAFLAATCALQTAIVMDFPPQRSLIKDFGSSFMDSLLLLNAQWQEEEKKKKRGKK